MDATLQQGDQVIERALAATGAVGMIAAGGVVAYFDPTTAGFFPVCPLYTLTGFACPGCGLTRGFHAMFHGDVLTALDYNAMLPLLVLLLGVALVSMVNFALRGRRATMKLFHPTALWVFFILLVVFGVARNLPWYPFNVLFP
jgi:hypothetical protein